MFNEKTCPACDMTFDWAGVFEDGEEFCCQECSQGLPRSCPQHEHDPVPLMAD